MTVAAQMNFPDAFTTGAPIVPGGARESGRSFATNSVKVGFQKKGDIGRGIVILVQIDVLHVRGRTAEEMAKYVFWSARNQNTKRKRRV